MDVYTYKMIFSKFEVPNWSGHLYNLSFAFLSFILSHYYYVLGILYYITLGGYVSRAVETYIYSSDFFLFF